MNHIEDVVDDAIAHTAMIVSSYVGHNNVPAGDLPSLVVSVFGAVSGLIKSGTAPAAAEPKKEPAVNPKKSVFPDYIICLEDGKRFKSLKRHISTDYDLTPEQYRSKWDLPADYPMVAPNYAAARSELAKKMGLGKKR